MGLERELINRYLLGVAAEAEDEGIGVRIIEDPSFAQEILHAEHDLIEDYLEGELSAAEHELFEQQYLHSNERRERVQEIALLKKYATRSRDLLAVGEPAVSAIPWYRSLKILVPAFGVLVLAIVASLFFVNTGSFGGVDYAFLNRQDLREPAVVGDAQIVQVEPGTSRSSRSNSTTLVTGESRSVLFRLPLMFSSNPQVSFSASIERGDKQVFTVTEPRVYKQGSLTEVRLLAPRDIFSPGTYQIRLVAREADIAPVLYTFEVR